MEKLYQNSMEKPAKTVFLGIYAGGAIALGGLLNIIANTLLSSHPTLGLLVGSLLFPIGLTMVCFFGFYLFTGKIGYVFDNKKDYLPFLLLVYIGNLIGAMAVGGLCLLAFRSTDLYQTALSIASKKMVSLNFLSIVKVFGGSVLCGALVYLAVFSFKTFKNVFLKLLGIFIPIGLFVFLKFDHCIANMFYFTFGWSYGKGLAYLSLFIVTLGNSIGAIFLNEGIKAFKKLIAKHE